MAAKEAGEHSQAQQGAGPDPSSRAVGLTAHSWPVGWP